MRILKTALRLAALSLMPLVCLPMLACGGKKPTPITFDSDFSVNISPVPSFWPREEVDWPEDELQRKVMQQAWVDYGNPDYFWFVHTTDRRIIRQSELQEGHLLAGRREKPLLDWVFIDRDLVVSFDGPKAVELPLTKRVRTVCLYGDPNEIRESRGPDGRMRTFWTYYNHGKIFQFDGDLIVDEKVFTPMGRFTSHD